MANEKEMNPLSGDRVETDGVYRDPYGREVELKAGEDFPMDPQLGQVDFQMISFAHDDDREDLRTDEGRAEQANVPVSAVSEESEESRQKRQLKHRLHGGDR